MNVHNRRRLSPPKDKRAPRASTKDEVRSKGQNLKTVSTGVFRQSCERRGFWILLRTSYFVLAAVGGWYFGAERRRLWPLPRSLAATEGIIVIFSSCRYLDVSVHGVSPRTAMDLPYGDRGFPGRVSPFGYLRIAEYWLLPAAFRS